MRRERYIQIILPYQKPLLKAALRRLRNTSDAEDVVQTTLLKAWVHFDTISKYEHLPQWLMRVMSNECIDIVRKKIKEHEYVNHASKTTTCHPSCEEEAALRIDIANVVNAMEEDSRNALVFSLLYGMTRREITRITGQSDGVIYGKLMRGKRAIRQYCQ